jgi:hypothetical protein
MLALARGGNVSKHGSGGDRRSNGRFDAKALPPPAVIDKIVPPHDLEAEHTFLSAMTVEYSDRIAEFAWLPPAAFFSERNRWWWTACLDLTALGGAVDIVTVAGWLKTHDKATIFEPADLIAMTHHVAATAHPEDYAKTIHAMAKLRELASVVQRVNARIYVDHADPADIFAEAEQMVARVSELAPGRGLHRLSAEAIFAPLPAEPEWLCKGLCIVPGRIMLVAGAPDSGKTLGVQSLGLSVATGKNIWGGFTVQRPGRVVHMNWDQPDVDTRRRYQKLARGLGLTINDLRGNLELVNKPPITFDDEAAFAELRAIAKDAAVVVIDALTGALGEVDENSPAVGRVLYRIGAISELTGCVIIIIHHASKPPPSIKGRKFERDPMFDVRGSGAITGAAGAVLVQRAIKKAELYGVTMARAPTGARSAVDPFALKFEDLVDEETGHALEAVRVSYVSPEVLAELTKPKDKRSKQPAERVDVVEQAAVRVLELMKREPKTGSSTLLEYSGMRKETFNAALERLFKTGRAKDQLGGTLGDRKPKEWVAV